MESEFIALDKAGEEAEWLRDFLEDVPIWPKPRLKILLYIQRQKALSCSKPSNTMAHGFLLTILLFTSIISPNIHACNQNERSALLSFNVTLSSPPLNWTSINCCTWEGITCNQEGWVTHLLLPSKGLDGVIFTSSSSLANLTHLTHLNLSNNSLHGSFENKLFESLDSLEILDLSYNLLFGVLPLSLTSRNIRTLDLSSNRFHGPIPSSFFMHAWNLTSFNVSNNAFSSYIPSSICLHSNPLIRVLDFSSNQFNGNILRGFGRCSELQIFHAGHNNLSGLLPEDIYNATKLEEIAVPLNSLYGGISQRIVNLNNLVILDLSFNQLSGVLPLRLGKLSRLKIIKLDFNDLQGSLPQSLMNCTSLVELRLAKNNLEGDITKLNFSKLVQLTKLDLYMNNFTGKLPTSLYSCRSLKAIRLASNNLEGQIQPEILSLNSLSFLSLRSLRLENVTGAMKILMHCKSLQILLLTRSFNGEEMPSDDVMVSFDGFRNLRLLSLAYCDLTGRIPVWLAKLKSLEILALDGNKITGTIPSWLGTDLPRLFNIGLSMNLISGEFPKELCRLPALVHELIAAQADQYDVELPLCIKNSRGVLINYGLRRILSSIPSSIELSSNNITGNIPSEIGQLQLLQELHLDNNNFSGNIPDQMSNLMKLQALSLSRNHLSGKIPSSLVSLNFLKSFDVSYNNLEGPIPTSTQLQSFEASAFERNPKLCGAPLPNECRTDAHGKNNHDGEDDGHQLPWLYISAVFGFIFGFWGVCGSLIVKKTWRYAYFQFIDNVQDRLYVMLAVRMNRMKRWLS
ncbi:receptor-like protein 2 [Pyrus x bretschneideri]|uniref:receptor-like protein 2 n=1 Tax=Pyrus x bretschneideri TaxID=225117 RepID=UPI002030A959|nr:receptor-like protein 2 [Pyrus x bretschneideri]